MIATYSLCEGMGTFIWGQMCICFCFCLLMNSFCSPLQYNMFNIFLVSMFINPIFNLLMWWFYVLWLKNDTLWKPLDWLTGKVLTWFLYLFGTCMYKWDYSENRNVAALNSLWCPIGQVCTIFISNIVNISWLKNDNKL